MRTYTHDVRLYLIKQLMNVLQVADIQHDGSDYVLLELQTGEKIILYLVETFMPRNELIQILQRHSQLGYHTLFLFWADMLLPLADTFYTADPWMEVALELYGGKIYGFDVYSREYYVFPVYFERKGRQYFIRYGKTVDFNQLRFRSVAYDEQTWRIADFGGAVREQNAASAPLPPSAQAYCDILGITLDADAETVKRAYRVMARQYHPDLNDNQAATEKMQQINEAYQELLLLLESDA